MSDSPMEIKTRLQIQKPAPEVFEAIVDPSKMSHYFIASSSGRMEEGKELSWFFPEFTTECPVRVAKMVKDQYVSFYWVVDQVDHLVEMTLVPKGNEATVVTVTEKGGENNEAGIKWLKGNTEGWANFLACLKGFLEYGINLRKGAFDFLSQP